MTTTLIVLAHPNPESFTAHWARATATASEALGHTVLWSDLHAQGFDPTKHPATDVLKAQEGALPPDVATEIEKIRAADRIIFHFPLWWFAPPAMLKGWFDRVLAHGHLHDVDNRFDTGLCKHQAALFCVTTGASAEECGPDGKEGDTRLLLWPAAMTLRYCGFQVLEPVIVHGVHGYNRNARLEEMEARLAAALNRQAEVVSGFDAHPRMEFNADSDFTADGRLRSDRQSVTPFIQRSGPD